MVRFMGDSIKTDKRRSAVIKSPLLNKGSAFTQKERDLLGLNGLLPGTVSTLDQQMERIYRNFSQRRTPLEKYETLIGLMNRNELLFYQFLARYPAEMLPIIYTPTVGEAAIQYSRIYFHQRGLYLSYPQMDRIEESLENYALEQVDVIVVTDGERILGLGDLGIGGMAIPIGKLSLYTLFAGIHPGRTLPIILDVGTNNEEFLGDDLYLGWRHKRISSSDFDVFIEKFVRAIQKKYPKVLLQWEDFGKGNARRILDRYRDQLLSFNDDIQGTAAVVLAALQWATREAKKALKNERVAILGAGSAGTGIADMIVNQMVQEGLPMEEARQRIYLVDTEGLICFATKNPTDFQKPYMQPRASIQTWKTHSTNISLYDTVANAKPSILIGVCAQTGAFTEQIISEMGKHNARPIIFPLSNPTAKAECTPEEASEWTQGRAIIATGSPFPDVVYKGKTIRIPQCNNVYIFPGLGLGALAAQASKITDRMLLAASACLGKCPFFPKIEEVRSISKEIALRVAQEACREGIAKCLEKDLEKAIASRMWEPHYPTYTP